MTKVKPVKIALDGPSGAGKSSLAKALASRLGLGYVDTGALYRTVGVAVANAGISVKDAEAVAAFLPSLDIRLSYETGSQVIYCNGKAVGDEIRTPKASMNASAVSAIPAVRDYLLDTQRKTAETNSVIMDGRDIGTVIFPDADVKIFLTASTEARAKRRHAELTAKGIETTLADVISDMEKRDENDRNRNIAPAIPASDAVILDNSDLTFEGTVDAALAIIESRLHTPKQKKKRCADKGSKAYHFFRVLLGKAVRFFLCVHPVGLENIPEKGGAVLCSNHIAIRDVMVLASAIDRQPRFLAKAELFKIPVLSGVIRMLGAVSLDRNGIDIGAVKTAISLAENGEIVTVFPQGTRRPGVNPADTPIKNGVGMIAYHAGVPLIPVCIKTKGVKYGFFRRVDVIIGKPINFPFFEGGREEYKTASDETYAAICRLGNYTPTALAAPGESK